MIKIVNLQNTLNPITAAERVKINQNWDEIRRAFSQIQLQVNFLAGGTEVDEIIERINNAIQMAEVGAQQAIESVNQALSDLTVVIANTQAATQQANEAKDNAISATNDARNAINEIASIMNDFRSLGPWNNTTSYKRNNIVSLNGNSYIALVDNSNTPVTNTSTWDLLAQRGQDGQRGQQGEAGASLNIRGVLPNESSLPPTGEPGDAYTISGDLYVWSAETNGWVNVGQIKGEKGDKGDKGDSGYYTLANFQYTVPATSEGQTTIEIPLTSFNPNDHSMLLFINSTVLRDDQYSISGRTITLNEPVEDYAQTTFYLNITQGVLIQPLDTINGSSIENGSISNAKLNNALLSQINGYENRITTLENQTNTSNANVAGLNREVAYLKLRQEASERIDGGTVFADDFKGSRFGFTLNEQESSNIKISNGTLQLKRQESGNINTNNSPVGNGIYTLPVNSGRKVVSLPDGSLIVSLILIDRVIFEISEDYGVSWRQLCFVESTGNNIGEVAMDNEGEVVHSIFSVGNDKILYISFNANQVNNTNLFSQAINVEMSQTGINSLSLSISETNGEVHAAWASKNSTLPNSFNVRYSSKGRSSNSWVAPTQITNRNSATELYSGVSVYAMGADHVITYSFKTATQNVVQSAAFINGVRNNTSLYSPGNYNQYNTSLAVGNDGVLHLSWNGIDADSSGNEYVRYSNSSNNGSSWSTPKRLTLGKDSSISVSGTNIFISYVLGNSSYYISSQDNGTNWSQPVLIGEGINVSAVNNYNLNFEKPLTVKVTSENVTFSGNFIGTVDVDVLSGTAVYDIASTDYVATFVNKNGNVDVKAYLNNVLMNSLLENNEYEFVGQMDNESQAKLRLEITRTSTSGGSNDALTRILGGRS